MRARIVVSSPAVRRRDLYGSLVVRQRTADPAGDLDNDDDVDLDDFALLQACLSGRALARTIPLATARSWTMVTTST
jgi:hypothetical protein